MYEMTVIVTPQKTIGDRGQGDWNIRNFFIAHTSIVKGGKKKLFRTCIMSSLGYFKIYLLSPTLK